MSGVVEIYLDHGKNPLFMDTLGRGSVIGMYNILKEESYSYSAWAAHSKGTIILAISLETINHYRKLKSELD